MYITIRIQQLLPNDYHQCLNYSESIIRLHGDTSFIETIILSDEAHCHLSSHVNRHDSKIWSDENPREIQKG